MPRIPDITDNEIWLVETTLMERYGEKKEVQIVDTEIRLHTSDRELTECPAFYWQDKDCHFIIVKAGDNHYRAQFFYRLHEQFGTSKDQFDDLATCIVTLLLIMKRGPIERAAAIAQQNGATLSVKTLRNAKAGLVITGNEVYHGLIEDRFAPILSEKVTALGSTVEALAFAPDDPEIISSAIRTQLERGCDLLMLSGGMSVDPDDVTRRGIRMAGAAEMHYGSAVLPGAMFLVAYIGNVPLLGIPACGLYHRTTVLDLVLPRILAGEKIGKAELALLGHGGLCKDCERCSYPHCPFGKGA